MSYINEVPRECEEVTADLTELALGVLSGRRRSEVLSHVESCGQCGAELGQLAFAVDMMLQLAPESEPPLGFEQRLVERFRASGTERRPRRFRRISVLFAVAVVLLVLGFGLGNIANGRNSNDHGSSPTADLTSASLTSRGQVFGEVFVSRGRPQWIFMSIDNRAWSGGVKCEVTLARGRVETVGKFKLSAGYGVWSAPLKSVDAQVRAAQLIASTGTVLARATFHG